MLLHKPQQLFWRKQEAYVNPLKYLKLMFIFNNYILWVIISYNKAALQRFPKSGDVGRGDKSITFP